MKRPPSLTVAALCFIVLGAMGSRDGAGLADLLNFITGIGLLKCWCGWRGFALFITFVTLVFLVPGSIYALVNPEWIVIKFPSILIDQREHPVIPRLGLAFIFSIYIGGTIWMLHTLLRRDVRALFQVRRA